MKDAQASGANRHQRACHRITPTLAATPRRVTTPIPWSMTNMTATCSLDIYRMRMLLSLVTGKITSANRSKKQTSNAAAAYTTHHRQVRPRMSTPPSAQGPTQDNNPHHSRLANEDERGWRPKEHRLAVREVGAERMLQSSPLLGPEELAVLPFRLRGAVPVPENKTKQK